MAGETASDEDFSAATSRIFFVLERLSHHHNISRNFRHTSLLTSSGFNHWEQHSCVGATGRPQVREVFQNIISQSLVSNQVVCMADWVAGCNYVYDNNRPIVSECGSLVLWLQGVPSSTVVFQLSWREIQTWWLITGLSRHRFMPLIHSGPGGKVREYAWACAVTHAETITHTRAHM